jgi:hypothetical protein
VPGEHEHSNPQNRGLSNGGIKLKMAIFTKAVFNDFDTISIIYGDSLNRIT